jgi:hypothetical protein
LLPDLLLPPSLLNKERNPPKKKKATLPHTTKFREGELQAQRLRATANCAREQHLRSIVVTSRDDDGGGCLLPSPAHL